MAGPASTRARTIASPEYFSRLCGDYAVTIQWGDGGESSLVVPVAGTHIRSLRRTFMTMTEPTR